MPNDVGLTLLSHMSVSVRGGVLLVAQQDTRLKFNKKALCVLATAQTNGWWSLGLWFAVSGVDRGGRVLIS